MQPRFESLLRALAASGNPEPLFILDDFEQNQPGAPQGQLDLNADAAAVLSALCGALQRTEQGRLLITGRYTLPQLFESRIGSVRLQPFDGTERAKHARRLAEAEASEPDRSLVARAQAAADGNPRLFEWLHKVLASEDLDTAQILGEMTQVEERFREHILARNLIESLPDGARDVLTRLSFLEVPVPLGAVRAINRALPENEIVAALERAEALGLVDREVEGALVLLHRGQAKDIAEARSHLAWAYRETHQRGYAEAANIASVFTQLGLDPNRLDYDL